MSRSTTPTTRARARRQAWPDDVRERALELLREGAGTAAAHRETGVPKPTLTRWAREQGIDVAEGTVEQARAGKARAEQRAAELALTTVERLERILGQQLAQLDYLTALEQHATELVLDSLDDGVTVDPDTGAATPVDPEARRVLAAAVMLGRAMPKRDGSVVARNAIHDLALLRGQATERGDVVVRIGIPRPHDSTAPVIDQAELGALTT